MAISENQLLAIHRLRITPLTDTYSPFWRRVLQTPIHIWRHYKFNRGKRYPAWWSLTYAIKYVKILLWANICPEKKIAFDYTAIVRKYGFHSHQANEWIINNPRHAHIAAKIEEAHRALYEEVVDCPECKGTGKVGEYNCPMCGGKKTLLKEIP